MLHSGFQYIIQSALYLAFFLIIYRWLLSKQTHFIWMRISLLGSLALGLILPLVTLPLSWHHVLPGADSIDKSFDLTFLDIAPTVSLQKQGNATLESKPLSISQIFAYGLCICYLFVVLLKLFHLGNKLLSIRASIKNNPRVKNNRYWFVQLNAKSPAYSFFHFIFIGKQLENISTEELERITSHEIIHSKQYHTVDILFVELMSVLLWINPLIKLYKIQLQEVHEYLADEKILKNTAMKKSYSSLLLKLTTEENPPLLSSAFSAKQIHRRISMIGKTRSIPRHRLLFLLLLPISASLLMSFSYLENRITSNSFPLETKPIYDEVTDHLKIGKIVWIDNTIYSDAFLNKQLGIKSGDEYNVDYLNKRLWIDEDAVSSLYLDDGYLFFQAEVKEDTIDNGSINVTISIFEGVQVKIRQILINENGSILKQDILDKILIQKGELFSKIKLNNSVKAIAQLDQFKQGNLEVIPNPIPIKDPLTGEFTLVDIEFKITEKQ